MLDVLITATDDDNLPHPLGGEDLLALGYLTSEGAIRINIASIEVPIQALGNVLKHKMSAECFGVRIDMHPHTHIYGEARVGWWGEGRL